MCSFLFLQCISLSGVALTDLTLRRASSRVATPAAHWCNLHSVTNLAIAYLTYPDLGELLLSPGSGALPAHSEWPPHIGLALHVYHAISYPMRPADWFHHGVFVFGCGPLCYFAHCRAMSLYYLFCTGLPGALDYAALALEKRGCCSRRTRRVFVGYNNAYFRMPGTAVCAFLVACTFVQTRYAPLAILALMAYLNGSHYGLAAIHAMSKV